MDRKELVSSLVSLLEEAYHQKHNLTIDIVMKAIDSQIQECYTCYPINTDFVRGLGRASTIVHNLKIPEKDT